MAGTAMGVGWGPRGRWSHVRVHHGAQLTSENSCEWTSFLFLVPKITNTRAHADGIRFRLESSGGHQEHQVQEPSCAALRSRTQHEQEQQQQQQPSSHGFRRRPSRLNAALQVPVVILSEKMIARDAQCREHRATARRATHVDSWFRAPRSDGRAVASVLFSNLPRMRLAAHRHRCGRTSSVGQS